MLLRPALFALLLLFGASAALAEQRCTGTLCDFYYGGPATDPDKPAPQMPATTNAQLPPGATPLYVPRVLAPRQTNADGTSVPAPADTSPSRFGVEGGGLIGMMNGTAPERCTGTLCDLYYGGPPPEKSATPPAAVGAAATAVADQDAAPPPYREERENVHRAPPTCAAKGRDPWSCYR